VLELVKEREVVKSEAVQNIYSVIFLSDGKPGELPSGGTVPKLHVNCGGDIIRDCLSYRSHHQTYTSACAGKEAILCRSP
jgi:hypothetical protein